MESGGKGRTEQFTPLRLDGYNAGSQLTVSVTGHDGQVLSGHAIAQKRIA